MFSRKKNAKERTRVVVDGKVFMVPKNKARQFRLSMGAAPKTQKQSLTRNQWSGKAYRYE